MNDTVLVHLSGQDHHGQPDVRRRPPDRLKGLDAAQPPHREIQNDEVHPLRHEQAEGLDAIASFEDLDVLIAHEEPSKDVPDGRIVVH